MQRAMTADVTKLKHKLRTLSVKSGLTLQEWQLKQFLFQLKMHAGCQINHQRPVVGGERSADSLIDAGVSRLESAVVVPK